MNIKKRLFLLALAAGGTFFIIVIILLGMFQDFKHRSTRADIAYDQVVILYQLNSNLKNQTRLVSDFLLGLDTYDKIKTTRSTLEENFKNWEELIEQKILFAEKNFSEQKEEEEKEKIYFKEISTLYDELSQEIEEILKLQLKGEKLRARNKYSSMVSLNGIFPQLTDKYIQNMITEELEEIDQTFKKTTQIYRNLLILIISIMLFTRMVILWRLNILNKTIVKRLRKLKSVAANFHPGQEKLLGIVDNKDEITSLSNSIAYMTRTINQDTFQLDYVNDRIKEILNVVDKTASGEYDLKCKISDKDDVFNNLSRGINLMIGDLVDGISKVQKQHDWLNLTLGNITDGIIVTDLDLNITFMNNTAEVLTGWDMKTVIGKDSDSILALSMENNTSFEKFLELKAHITAYPGELILTSKNGRKIPIEIDMRDLVDSEQSIWGKLIIFRDNSEILDKNKKMAIMQEKIVQNEKLSGIGLLTAGIAHEINNPISYIQSNFRTLRKRLEKIEKTLQLLTSDITPEEKKSTIEKADLDFILSDIDSILNDNENGIDKIHTIVTGMKSFATKETADSFVKSNLNEIVHDTLKITNNESKYIADIKFLPTEEYSVECRPKQIGQVLLNLIINAIHALKDRQDQNDRKGIIDIEIHEIANFTICTIRDNGTGIPNEVLPQIFDPFFTTKEPGHGTGLGLNVSYNIIKNHGGELSARNHPDGGAEFTIKLPKKQQ